MLNARCALSEPGGIKLGSPVLEEYSTRMRQRRGAEIDAGHHYVLRALERTGHDRSIRRADEGLAGEGQSAVHAHAVAQADEVAVLEGGHAHLGLEQAL